MELEKFRLPSPDTRLLMVDSRVYKVKLRQRGCADGEDSELKALYDRPETQKDLKKVLLYTLVNIDDVLHPIQTNDLVVYPYKSHWKAAQKLNFYQHNQQLDPYPEILTLYVEWKHRVNLGGSVAKSSTVLGTEETLGRDNAQEESVGQVSVDKENQHKNRKQPRRKLLHDQVSDDESPINAVCRPKRRRVLREEDSDSNCSEINTRQHTGTVPEQWSRSDDSQRESVHVRHSSSARGQSSVGGGETGPANQDPESHAIGGHCIRRMKAALERMPPSNKCRRVSASKTLNTILPAS